MLSLNPFVKVNSTPESIARLGVHVKPRSFEWEGERDLKNQGIVEESAKIARLERLVKGAREVKC